MIRYNSIILSYIYIAVLFCHFCQCKDANKRMEEFCLSETFKPVCSGSDVLIVHKAKFGRMNIGKCLTEKELEAFSSQTNDFKYLGCHNDVTDILNSKCAFNKTCEFKVFDFEKIENTACHLGLKMYLEVHYSCLPVVQNEDDCHIFATSRAKYLNPHLFQRFSCGSREQFLIVEAPKGQRIRLTLELFSKADISGGVLSHSSCNSEIGLTMDKQNNKNFTLCQEGIIQQNHQGGFAKEVISHGNFFSIALFPEKVNTLILIKIEAHGCLDIIPPEDTWLKRNDDDVVVGCYSSKQTWYLRCESKQWVGSIGNCSVINSVSHNEIESREDSAEKHKLIMSSTQQVLIIVAICGFGVVACLSILCIGALCLKRLNNMSIKEKNYFNVSTGHYNNGTYNQRGSLFQTCHKQSIGNNPEGLLCNRGHSGPLYLSENVDDERYQVLDKDEVAKEGAQLV